MSLPNFLCVGAQKAATTWLYRVLAEHPGVWIPPIGEPHFFDMKGKPLRARQVRLARRLAKEKAGTEDAAAFVEYLRRIARYSTISQEWYEDLFSWASPDMLKGDITPAYLELPEESVSFARELLGDAKIIIIVRRPLERDLSQLRMWAERGVPGLNPPESTEQWSKLYTRMTSKESRGGYSTGIPRWQKRFSNVLLLPFGEIRDNPRDLIRKVEGFLGLPNYESYEILESVVHASKKVEIPAEVVQQAAERTKKDDDFIKNTLGEEFYLRTK